MVLHGPNTRPAALDIESKCSEAALSAVQLADFRNFAHGRHHWLAKKGEETGILSFSSDSETEIAEKTLKLLPSGIPVARIHVHGEAAVAALSALTASRAECLDRSGRKCLWHSAGGIRQSRKTSGVGKNPTLCSCIQCDQPYSKVRV